MDEIIDLSVVIPIYNNDNVLIELNNQLIEELVFLKYEIIYVNDCSPDRAIDTLTFFASKYPRVRPINLSKNIGQQKATLEGLKKAVGQKIVVLDGDLQDSPKLIPDLYNKNKSEGDAVFVKRKGIYQSMGRMMTSILIKKVIQLISGLHYKAGSYYLFDSSIKKKVIFVASNCKHPYMSIIVAHFSNKIKYVSATRGKNTGPSGYNFRKRIKAAIMAIYCSLYCTYTRLTFD